MLLLCTNILYSLSLGQSQFAIRGVVVDENSKALPGATVFLEPVNKGTITDEAGKFEFRKLDKGRYNIKITFVGYAPISDSIRLDDAAVVYNAQLSLSPVYLEEVVVKDNYKEMRKKETALNVEIVDDAYLRQNLGGSLMKSLDRLPGVTTLDIGSGHSKPVIRGLSFNRVVVVENSIKHEAQQWGADHGLEVDQYAIDRIEVIKGPASLMYGSDAIGGVIDLKNRKLPEVNSLGGTIDLTGRTNNDFLGTSLALQGRKNWFFASIRATLLDYGDYKVPTDSVDIYSYRAALHKNHLRNTAGEEQNLHASFGVIQKKIQSKFYVSNVTSKSGFFANAHGLEPRSVDTDLHDKSSRDIHYPYQTVSHFKLINTSYYQWDDRLQLELDLGGQRNFRQEWSQYVSHGYMPAVFPDTLSFNPDLERQFEKYVYSGNLKLSYELNDKANLKAGLSSEYQDNRIDGRGFIIPAYQQLTIGGYAFVSHTFSKRSEFQFGVRYDYGHIHTEAYRDWFSSPVTLTDGDTSAAYLQRAGVINRSFSNVSWSIGYNYSLEKWLVKANVGKSFRMPIAKELAANGVNYHRFSYEVGNSELSPEVSYQFDLGVTYGSGKLSIGLSPFFNYFLNYIYLNPSSDHDRLYGNGNQVYYYTQSKVMRYGGELHFQYQLIKSIQLEIVGEYIYSKQLSGEKKGYTLPFSPPPSAIFSIRYQKQKIRFIETPYLFVDYKATAAQNNIVPPEESTDGYQVINTGLGGTISLFHQQVNISLQVQNLFNTKYFNHTSYYRLINVPEPGRNFIVNVSIPFSTKQTKNNNKQ